MSRVVDLSYPLSAEVALPKNHPPVEYRLIETHAEHGRTNATLSFSIHTGTHIDPPYHFIEDGATIDQIPVETLMASGFLFDVRSVVRSGEPITLAMLRAVANPPSDLRGAIVLINSGWAEEAYFTDHYWGPAAPFIGQDTADWLAAQRVRAVGINNPAERPNPGAKPHHGDCPIHRTLLAADVLLIENLTNLDQLNGAVFDVFALPIKLANGCGGPARVVALIRG